MRADRALGGRKEGGRDVVSSCPPGAFKAPRAIRSLPPRATAAAAAAFARRRVYRSSAAAAPLNFSPSSMRWDADGGGRHADDAAEALGRRPRAVGAVSTSSKWQEQVRAGWDAPLRAGWVAGPAPPRRFGLGGGWLLSGGAVVVRARPASLWLGPREEEVPNPRRAACAGRAGWDTRVHGAEGTRWWWRGRPAYRGRRALASKLPTHPPHLALLHGYPPPQHCSALLTAVSRSCRNLHRTWIGTPTAAHAVPAALEGPRSLLRGG